MRIISFSRSLVLLGSFTALLGATGGLGTPIVAAAKNGDRTEVRALLQKNADVNAAEADGTTALHWASYRDDLAIADLLLRARAKVNAASDLGVTPLWTACENASEPMVRRLLDAGANPNAALMAGETPVMVAARSGNPKVVEMLLAKGGNPNAHGARGQTALMWAVAQKHPEVVKVLLANRADLNARSETYNEVMAVPPHGYLPYNRTIPHGHETALLFAARAGDLDSAKLLVAAGAGVNDTDAWGVSAIVLAEHSGFRDLVLFLLDKGADPNLAAAGFTALHEAIMRRDDELVAALLEHGADPNAPLKVWTPVRRSARDFHFEPGLVGASPFWLAARFTEPGAMKLLARHGADPLFVHRSDTVVSKGFKHQIEVTNALMASVGMGGGSDAWIKAPRREREPLTLEAVKLSVSLGNDLNATDTDGRTALDAATALKYESVVKFLIEHGAKAGIATGAPHVRPTDGNDGSERQ